jgi:citrate synthase
VSALKQKLSDKIEFERSRVKELLKNHGNVKVDEVRIEQVLGGMRGIKSLVSDISYLDPVEGIRYRGLTIQEVIAQLPKPPGKKMPYVEAMFYFLLSGEVPTEEEVQELIREFEERARMPHFVIDVLRAMPRDTHPMTMFSAAVLSMQRHSRFAVQYSEGLGKADFWEPVYEDSLDLIAKLPSIAAYIFRMRYRGDTPIFRQPGLDFGSSFAQMMGIAEPYDEAARLYFMLHADHELGNVSAHATHLVASALSDPYLALSAGLNGLAGPLHGLANQEVLRWILGALRKLACGIPSKERPVTECTRRQLDKFVRETLEAGQVVPGFGHAVLRKTDPRYTALWDYIEEHFPDYYLFNIVKQLYEVVPPILRETGKVKNPWPNVDGISGVLQYYYGITEFDFYTVLFGMGRALGVLSQMIWSRALGLALERPKSLTIGMLEKIAAQQ